MSRSIELPIARYPARFGCNLSPAPPVVLSGTYSAFNSPVVSSPVRIGAGTWVGDRVAILAGANIGKGCFIGANSIIRGNIPDYSIAVGMPGRVVGNVLEQYSSDTD